VLDGGGFILTSHIGSASVDETELLDAEGHTIKALAPSLAWQVSPDGKAVVYGTGDTVHVVDPQGKPLGTLTSRLDPSAIVDGHVYLIGEEKSIDWVYATDLTKDLPAHVVAVSDDRTRAALFWYPKPQPEGTEAGCWAIVDLTKSSFPHLVEQCGKANTSSFTPRQFMPGGEIIMGTNYSDGGYYFMYAGLRVSDGALVYGGYQQGGKMAPGWGQRASSGGTFLLSLNDSQPLYPPAFTKVVRCTLEMSCSEVAPRVSTGQSDAVPDFPQRHYVIAG
jgi:hypothetical protein